MTHKKATKSWYKKMTQKADTKRWHEKLTQKDNRKRGPSVSIITIKSMSYRDTAYLKKYY